MNVPARSRLGHFAAARWRAGPDEVPELFVGGEGLERGPNELLGTLLHEAAHGLGSVRGVQDTSRQGRYHNERYRALAEELGLRAARIGAIGWSDTTVVPETELRYRSALERLSDPLPERRMSLPGQMAYLFLMSIIPTVPSAWLILAEDTMYSAYDRPFRLWGVDIEADQQVAGLIMKLGAGTYLWILITVLFFRWALRHEKADRAGRLVSERDVLTWEHVQQEFERSSPAAAQRPTGRAAP